jgi:4-hydroxybenzoate polyprenyltransferase
LYASTLLNLKDARMTSMQGLLYGWRGAPLLRRLTRHAQLMRLNKPIGIGLLLWPTLWALFIAARGLPGEPTLPSLKLLIVFIAGTVAMRSAGCVINDFADRNIDPQVKRTKGRPLALRLLSPHEALVSFGALVLLALVLVLQLDARTVYYSFVGAALTVSYPFMKRFFALPQFWLGAAFGWAVPMAFVATLGGVPRLGWLLFIVTVLWAAVYDTQYAMVDRDDDLKIGVQSTAIAFGDMDKMLIGAMQFMVLAGLAFTGYALQLAWPFWLALGVAAALFAWQQWLIRNRERDACLKAFLNNNWVGMVLLVGIAAS